MLGVFSSAIKFDCLFSGIFSKFSLICDFYFWQLAPPWIYVSNDTLNHFLVNSSAKNSLKRAKNVIFFLFCILVGRPMEGGYSPRLPHGYATAGTASYYGKSGPD